MNTPKYQSALFNKMAQLYCECLVVRKAHEYSEAAALLAKATPILGLKYRLARTRTQRKLGDYLDAMDALATLEKEIADQMEKADEESSERR